jgi:hypothetical protein
MRALALCTLLLAAPAMAGEKPLSAEEFDALTKGTTFDTYSWGAIYGIEKFLPDRRSLWQDADGCKYGTWAQVGEQICFYYEDDPQNPDCWIYVDTPEGILGYYQGDMADAPITLLPSATRMTCDEYIGA